MTSPMRNFTSALLIVASLSMASISPVSAQVIFRSTTAELPQAVGGFIDAHVGEITSFNMFGGMPDDPLGMLRQKQIQDELNLSAEQIAVVEELQKDMQRQSQEIFTAQAKFGGNAIKMMEAAQKAVRKTITKELKEILDIKQMKRLGQLEVQMKMKNRGARALTEEKLAKALNITDDQKTEIRDKSSEMSKQLQKEIEKLREQHRKQLIKDVLSDDQLSKLQEISGNQYEVQPINIRRFGGGREKN